MDNFNIEQEANKITVSIRVKLVNEDYSIGTGIIVIPQKDEVTIGYLFTAQHVVIGKDSFSYNKYDSSPMIFQENDLEIKLNDININIIKNTFYKPNEKEDFAFALVDLKSNNILFLPRIKISNYDLIYQKDFRYVTLGYPNISDELSEALELKSPSELPVKEGVTTPRIRLQSVIPVGTAKLEQKGSNIVDNLEGFSGAGVFFTDNTEVHLTGLVVEASGFSSIIILNFNKITEIANLMIEEILLNDTSLNFNLLETNTMFNYGETLINLKDINNDDILNFIKTKIGDVNYETVKELKSNSKTVETEKSRIDLQIKELAKNCAYIGAEYNKEKRYHLATRYFNYAISIDSSYNTVFLTAKHNRKKGDNIKEIIENSDKIIYNPYKDSISKFNALKEKIFILEENNSDDRLYEVVCDLLITAQTISPPISTDEVQPYINKCKKIINEENTRQISIGSNPSIEPYIYMSEICRDFNLLEESVYFLTCAKELLKLLRKNEENGNTLNFINSKIDLFIEKNTLTTSTIFNAQREAEKTITYIEKIKIETEENILADISIIIEKINQIYNQSNDTGLLKRIDENIRSLLEKNPLNDKTEILSLIESNNLPSQKIAKENILDINKGKVLNNIMI